MLDEVRQRAAAVEVGLRLYVERVRQRRAPAPRLAEVLPRWAAGLRVRLTPVPEPARRAALGFDRAAARAGFATAARRRGADPGFEPVAFACGLGARR